MKKTLLRGMTWNHSRGITPLLAASQRYSELHPGVEIEWQKRSLQEFADYPIEKLTGQFDLLIIDHPWVGRAAATDCIIPLDGFIPATYLADQLMHSVGKSCVSYNYDEKQWALAIDAATPVASFREDLFQGSNVPVPKVWEDVLKLAGEGKVAVPAIPIDMLMNFYSFCLAFGNRPFGNKEEVITKDTGRMAIRAMKELYSCLDETMYDRNPIAVAEMMTSSDKYWYCPFAYGYTNYSRDGYAKHRLTYADVVKFNGDPLQTTIGGTGLAVSAFSRYKNEAVDFAMMVCSGEFQRTLYVQNGGQPGHLAAWKDELANRCTHDFFRNVLPAMERGYMRPRYNGYLEFQDKAGDPLRECLLFGADEEKTLDEMNRIYRNSFAGATALL